MLDFIFGVVFEFIFETIMIYPGAFIRWIFLGGKKSYKELIITEDSEINVSISMFTIGFIILGCFLIFK